MKLVRAELTIIFILFLGILLRIHDLSGESIWLDEGFSIRWANLNLVQIIEETSKDVHPPLYYIILHYWIILFGNSEFSTRFLSVVFGFFSIFVIYKVGSLIFNKEVGILGSLILGLSLFHIQYSQEVRAYSLMALLSLLSFYFFIKFLKNGTYIHIICYILSSILLIYTHFFGLFIIVSQNIYLIAIFLSLKKVYGIKLKKWFLIQIILIVLFTPWINILMNQILQIESGFWISKPSINSIINSFVEYSSGSTTLLLIFIILIFYSILKINIDFKYSKRNFMSIHLSNFYWNYLLLFWLLIPIILPFIISQFSTPIYTTRNTISASMAFYLLIAKGITNINNKFIKSFTIFLIIILPLGNLWGYYTEINKEQWREVADYIDLNSKPGDLILFNAGAVQENGFDYYSKRKDIIKKPFTEKTRDIDENNIKELWPIVEGYQRVWVILSHSNDDKGLIKKTLNESYNMNENKEYKGIMIYLFIKNK